MHRQMGMRPLALLFAAAWMVACAGVPRVGVELRQSVPVADARALAEAVELFHRAQTPDALVEAVERARKAGPESGAYHLLAADLARLQLRERDEVDHLLTALEDVSFDAAPHALRRVELLSRTDAQQARWLGLLEALQEGHPSPEARAHAAFLYVGHLHALAAPQSRLERVKPALGTVLPLWVAGGWDNDQGKGFDQALPPEDATGVDLSARYEGALMELGWSPAPVDPRGVAELREYLAPDRWSVAYAASAFSAPTAGRYELRLAISDPVKVFVDGVPVLEAREHEGAWAFDGLVIPLQLSAGDHQVLIKSAHRTGEWRLFARVTGERGAPLPAEAAARKPGKVSAQFAQRPRVLGEDDVLEAAVAELPEGSALRATRRAQAAQERFGGAVAVRAAQEAARTHAGIVSEFGLVSALWSNGERGRTADELNALHLKAGEALPLLKLEQARFWMQEGLRQRARAVLTAQVEAMPDSAPPARQLAALFAAERWQEDECAVWQRLDRAAPPTQDVKAELAACLLRDKQTARALGIFDSLRKARPNDAVLMWRLHGALREKGDEASTARLAEQMVKAHPYHLWPRQLHAEALRRLGKEDESLQVLRAAREAFPMSSDVWRAEASLLWRRGEKAAAIEAWQAALQRSPEDDEIANRLDFVAPAASGPWAADVPDDARLSALVGERAGLKVVSGADLAWHMDQEVVQLRADGSTINVVTHVVTALNQSGRDKLTRRRLSHAGRKRVMHAYSVDAKGRRSEASVRAAQGEVLYRGLEVGSTIVLQYRADSPPGGFLPRYLGRTFFFSSPSEQKTHGELILWYPAGQTLQENVVGAPERTEERRGDEVRVAWRKRDVQPLLPEPNMPGLWDVAEHVQVTTVPGWDAYLRWEEALLEGALRDSPEVDALASRLVEGADTAEEKLLRIHGFVMEEIRYQQDYQSFIAGVKPHPASMVVERRYGDCKDKTVLFMTLAKKAGLQAHFATVRTRDRGQVRRGLPTQQFNHAIVYVPPQPGLSEGRFFDSTAEALDLDVLRDDNAGTEALVYDPATRKFDWIPIPYQTPAHHRQETRLQFALTADGAAKGELAFSARGRSGGVVRRMSRNPEQFKQFMQLAIGSYFTGASTEGAEAVETQDLRSPAHVRTAFIAPNAARVEGESLRMRLPTDWSPKGWFRLTERRHPLVLGTPNEMAWRFLIALPEGAKVARLPSSGEIATPCLTFRRDVRPGAKGVEVEQTLRVTCERISAEEYGAYRTQMESLSRFLDEELVVTPAAASGPRSGPKQSAPLPPKR